MLKLSHFSLGVGDRFAHQARAQLQACLLAADRGVEVVPVWNKSHREHTTVGSQPVSVRRAADEAVRSLGWALPYHVDADHIRLETVDAFLSHSDFFTLDVADCIGQVTHAEAARNFASLHPELTGRVEIPGIDQPFELSREQVIRMAQPYMRAVEQAGRIYRHIAGALGEGNFITEVSIDETDAPQTPPELLVVLAALADERIPLQTIAPKFTGRFNKGVDYAGDVARFAQEFRDDLAVVAYAVQRYGLPENLKLSVHSGSDKFSIYEPIRRAIAETGAGLHLKTAGTTWLEEVIGLAEAGGDGLQLAKEIYEHALEKQEALCAPYAAVIDIDPRRLPSAAEVNGWSSEEFVAALRHDPANPGYNPSLRQLVHVGYKIAAQLGDCYLRLLEECEPVIARNVTGNLYERHIQPLFLSA